MTGGPSRGPKSEINVTPLVDVVLVLLIIFMVVTPMLQRGKDVQLPKAHTNDEEHKDADPLVLSVTQDHQVWIENNPYDEAGLAERLGREMAQNPTRKVLVKGDDRLTFGDIRKVMDTAKKAGAKGIALAVQEIKEP